MRTQTSCFYYSFHPKSLNISVFFSNGYQDCLFKRNVLFIDHALCQCAKREIIMRSETSTICNCRTKVDHEKKDENIITDLINIEYLFKCLVSKYKVNRLNHI
jgi:hypothetical protein